MTLYDCDLGHEVTVLSVSTGDAELEQFLFSLGLYSGEPVSVTARRRGGCTVAIKDAKYSIDKALANAIEVENIY